MLASLSVKAGLLQEERLHLTKKTHRARDHQRRHSLNKNKQKKIRQLTDDHINRRTLAYLSPLGQIFVRMSILSRTPSAPQHTRSQDRLENKNSDLTSKSMRVPTTGGRARGGNGDSPASRHQKP